MGGVAGEGEGLCCEFEVRRDEREDDASKSIFLFERVVLRSFVHLPRWPFTPTAGDVEYAEE